MGLVNQACKRPMRAKVSSKRKKPKLKDLLFAPKPDYQRYLDVHARRLSKGKGFSENKYVYMLRISWGGGGGGGAGNE